MEPYKILSLEYDNRTIEIKYVYIDNGSGLKYLDVLDKKGDRHRFYNGMYEKNKWTTASKLRPDFLVKLYAAFDQLTPEYIIPRNPWA